MGKHLLSPPSRGEAPKSLSTSSSSHYFFTLTTKHYLNSPPWFSHIFQFPLLLVSSPCLHSPFHHSLAFLPGPGVSSRAMRQFWEAHCVRRCHGLSSPSWGSFDGAGDYSPRSLGCIPLSHCSGCRIYIHICSHRGAILKVIAQKKKTPTREIPFRPLTRFNALLQVELYEHYDHVAVVFNGEGHITWLYSKYPSATALISCDGKNGIREDVPLHTNFSSLRHFHFSATTINGTGKNDVTK